MSLYQERINLLRQSIGKAQQDIAKDLGVTPQAFSYYVNGREPGYDLLIKIADYFGVTLDYLLGRSDYKNPEDEERAAYERQNFKKQLRTTGSEKARVIERFVADFLEQAAAKGLSVEAGDVLIEILESLNVFVNAIDKAAGVYSETADLLYSPAELDERVSKEALNDIAAACFMRETLPRSRQLVSASDRLLDEIMVALPSLCSRREGE